MVLWLFFVKASSPGDLHFDILMFHSVTRGSCAEAFTSKLAAWLEPRGGTLLLYEAASSEFALDARSAPPGHAFVTAAVPREGLNWCSAIMVGDFSSRVFARNELLT